MIYLRNAKQIWKDVGCNEGNKYAPTVDNKDTLFNDGNRDGNIGWAREDYARRVKSMREEANKAEFNYYDWGEYENAENEGDANKWQLITDKKLIKRPSTIEFPMGIRKAKSICYGENAKVYVPPKVGDRVKINKMSINMIRIIFQELLFAEIVELVNKRKQM